MSILSTINKVKSEINKNNQKSGSTMQLRLFMCFILFLLAVMFCVLIILSVTGVLKTGKNETKTLFESELLHISNDVYRDFGNISLQGVELAKSLSKSIEYKMNELGVNVHNFNKYPQCLESILNEEVHYISSSLEKTKSSGAFIILDATVNPEIEGSEFSRAGIYIKNMEPNIINDVASNLRFLRGPMNVAFNNNIYILPQWKMEFNIKDSDYFKTVLEKSKQSKLPLSRLYLWTDSIKLVDSDDDVMLCILPLISDDNTVFGLCGFEISSMLFKLSYSPNNSKYSYIFSTLSKYTQNKMLIDGSFFAGSYSAYPSNLNNNPVKINTDTKFLNTYQEESGDIKYVGMHKEIALYPADSLYKDDLRILSILVPENEVTSILRKQNLALTLCFLALMLLSVFVCLVISKKYIKPVVTAFELIKTVSPSDMPKTRIVEIDDLIEFLAAHDESSTSPLLQNDTKNSNDINLQLYQEFIKNIDALSTAERTVFNLYLKGHTAKEIADILYLSINTIKTHNKRIYMKLNVSSRKELMVYIKMMEEMNSPLLVQSDNNN